MLPLEYLRQLSSQLRSSHQRYAIQLNLKVSDSVMLLTQFIEGQDIASSRIAWLGGSDNPLNGTHYPFKKGKQLLGQEIDLLVVDCRNEFDANSFNAALGALKGGGILFVIGLSTLVDSYQTQWLKQHFAQWPSIDDLENHVSPTDNSILSSHYSVNSITDQQSVAVDAIKKVVTGHRRRPLVINANRGRGKTASLGMAAGLLMSERVLNIVITAPAIQSLTPLFEFVDKYTDSLNWVTKKRTHWILSNGSQLRFIAPDELSNEDIEADLVLVDEAAALPLPMLKKIVRRFHRVVFSSTIHGYEGCGRGFSIKFMSWLDENRPGWKQLELTQPIRWADDDPLERWSFDTFLLDADKCRYSENSRTHHALSDLSKLEICHVSKQELLHDPELFRSLFGLLVAAHYQTSPNDLMQVLGSDDIQVLRINSTNNLNGKDELIGCLLVCYEGGFEPTLISDIQRGVRRPKGHLAAAHLCNHLGMSEPGMQMSARIMRIAVSPEYQNQGIGSYVLKSLPDMINVTPCGQSIDFISVSFGATAELIHFWKQDFTLVALGSRRDHTSGHFSAFMVRPLTTLATCWVEKANLQWKLDFQHMLCLHYQALEHDTLASILYTQDTSEHFDVLHPILLNYSQGGNSFESAAPHYARFLFDYLTRTRVYPVSSNSMDDRLSLTSMVIDKVLLFRPWDEVAHKYQLAGKKQVEQKLRTWLIEFTL